MLSTLLKMVVAELLGMFLSRSREANQMEDGKHGLMQHFPDLHLKIKRIEGVISLPLHDYTLLYVTPSCETD